MDTYLKLKEDSSVREVYDANARRTSLRSHQYQ